WDVGGCGAGKRLLRVKLYLENDLIDIRDLKLHGRTSPNDPWPSEKEAIENGFSRNALREARDAKRNTRPGLRVTWGKNGKQVCAPVLEYDPQTLKKIKDQRNRPLSADRTLATRKDDHGLSSSTVYRLEKTNPYGKNGKGIATTPDEVRIGNRVVKAKT